MAYLISGVGQHHPGNPGEWVDVAFYVQAGVMCVVRGVFVPRERTAWIALGAGMISWGIGDAYYTAWLEHLPLAKVPSPSISDGFWLSFYGGAYIAIFALLKSRITRFPISTWLDGIVAGLSVAALTIVFVLEPVRAVTHGTVGVVATGLAYPVADTLLLAFLICAFAFTGWRPNKAWLLITLGFLVNTAGDVAYLLKTANDTYIPGGWVDALWPIGMSLLVLAAWVRPRKLEARSETRGMLVPPLVFTLISLGVLIWGNIYKISSIALPVAALALVVALVRMGLAFIDLQKLADSRRQARTDELTGLGNRRDFNERLAKQLETASDGDQFAVMLIDLNHFKEINDTLGHHAGDVLLSELGPRLSKAIGSVVGLERLGGDEFAVITHHAQDKTNFINMAQAARRAILRPFDLDGLRVRVDASVGIAMAPEHGETPALLLQHADIAMYQAKRRGRGFASYDPGHDNMDVDRLTIAGDLRDAIEESQFVLHYQPKADLKTGHVIGVEALIRWEHPRRSLLGPGVFIAIAEQAGLMPAITMHVLKQAVDQCKDWKSRGIELPVAINLSPGSLLDFDLCAQLERVLTEVDLEPRYLKVEITEDAVMTDPERVGRVLRQVQDFGVSTSLDDFGTGHSSLSLLKLLPFDELKIDRSFVGELDTKPQDASIVDSMIRLGSSLGLQVVAEGIETSSIWEKLRDLQCDYAQGFYLSPPLPAVNLERWLALWQRSHHGGWVAVSDEKTTEPSRSIL